jgi:hypothetical protein
MIAAALKADREKVLPLLDAICNEALGEAHAANVNALKLHEREMALSIRKLEVAVDALERALVMERNRFVDLPNPMKNVN